MRRSLSLRAELILLLGAFVLIAAGSLGSMSYEALRTAIERYAVNEVGIAANARKQALIQLLDQQRVRAEALLKTASLGCAPEEVRCVRRVLADFVATEGARAVRLDYRGRTPIGASASPAAAMKCAAPTRHQRARL